MSRLLLLLAAGTAVASFVYEIGWIRMLSLVLGSSTHAFELMLSAFILGLSLGAWWMRKRADRFADPLRALAMIQLVMGALAIASLPLYIESFQWSAWLLQSVARSNPGYLLYSVARYLICLAVMLPATFCAGMTLPLMTNMLMRGAGEQAIGAIYGANTLGSIVGAAATGLIFLPAFGLKGTLIGGGVLDMLLGLVVLGAMARSGVPVRRLMLAGAGAAALLACSSRGGCPSIRDSSPAGYSGAAGSPTAGSARCCSTPTGAPPPCTRAGSTSAAPAFSPPTASPTARSPSPGSSAATPSRRCGVFSGDDGTQAMLALLLLAHAPAAKNGAVIGHGTGMSSHFPAGESGAHPADHHRDRARDAGGLPGVLSGQPAGLRRSPIPHRDRRRQVLFCRRRHQLRPDPLGALQSLGERGERPLHHRVLRRIRGYLAPGAVFGQWLHTYELTDGLVESVLAALHQNFADYRIYLINRGDMLVVASADGPLRRPDWSVVRLPMVRQDLCRFLPMADAALERTLLVDRKGLAPLFAGDARANSDFYPVLDLGAERARFLQQSAAGLANLGNGVIDFLGDPSLRPRTSTPRRPAS